MSGFIYDSTGKHINRNQITHIEDGTHGWSTAHFANESSLRVSPDFVNHSTEVFVRESRLIFALPYDLDTGNPDTEWRALVVGWIVDPTVPHCSRIPIVSAPEAREYLEVASQFALLFQDGTVTTSDGIYFASIDEWVTKETKEIKRTA